jgi:hypothetical protein
MFLRTALTVTLFTPLLTATDLFSVRSFRQPGTKAKIPVTAQLLTNVDERDLLTQTEKVAALKPEMCTIPLQQAKPAKTHDNMTQFAGPHADRSGVMSPPVPACRNWK